MYAIRSYYDRRVDHDGRAAELHRARRVGGGADPGVEDHRHRAAGTQELEVVGIAEAHAGADRRAQRHDRRAAHVGQLAAGNRVVVAVRHNREAVVNKRLGA